MAFNYQIDGLASEFNPNRSLVSFEKDLLTDKGGVTVFVTGRQWYWEFEYNIFYRPSLSCEVAGGDTDILSFYSERKNFSSYMLPKSELKSCQLRLLTVDNPLYIP
jgi:heme/copper-type cytochrome/quinol oxidase subunit 2